MPPPDDRTASLATADWQRRELAVCRFEDAWRQGPRPNLDDFLPADESRLAVLIELAAVDLERRLAAGEPARAEDYLSRYPKLAADPARLRQLIVAEYRLRQAHEPGLPLEEYRRRFPTLEGLASLFTFGNGEAATLPPPALPPEPSTLMGLSGDAHAMAAALPDVRGYEVLGELGRGGMGVVYQARQLGLGRLVALKMILAGEHAGADDRRRFRAEAEAVARLQHPHIVQVFEVGEQGGRPFFSMEYVGGGSLAQQLDGTPWPAPRAAALVESLARAVQAAHERGIIHRDLKPANVLLAADGTPKVTDFGLAKRLDGASSRTATGAVLGTPSYMAPEQASGKTREIGPPADVYGLGAILYELLTGRPPFRAATPIETVLQVVSEDPLPPRRLQPKIPRDLDTICLKCLHKEPHRRYTSAGALVDDLAHFRKSEPIHARPVRAWEHALKWARRRPAIAGLLAALIVVIGGSLAGMMALWLRAADGRKAARESQALAEQGQSEARTSKALAEKNQALAEQRLIESQVASGVRLMDDGDLLGAIPWFVEALSQEKVPSRQKLQRIRLGSILQQCPRLARWWGYEKNVWAQLSLDGRRVLTVHDDHDVYMWDNATEQRIAGPFTHPRLVSNAVPSPDGSHFITICGEEKQPGEARLWNVATGRFTVTALGPLPVGRRDAVFSPDGRKVAILNGGHVDVRDVATGRSEGPALEDVEAPAFSQDGRRLALAVGGDAARVWDIGTHQFIGSPMVHGDSLQSVEIDISGRWVVTASSDGTARVWSVDTGAPLSPPLRHEGFVSHASFSPDGRRVVTCGADQTARVWDAASGQAVSPILKHRAPVGHAAFSPDGRWVITGANDGTVRVWDAISGAAVTRALEHGSSERVGFFADGHRIWAYGGELCVWDLAGGLAVSSELHHRDAVTSVAFSPDGRTVLTASDDRTSRLWRTTTARPVSPPLRHRSWVRRSLFDYEGRRLLTVSGARGVVGDINRIGNIGETRWWEATTGRPLSPSLVAGSPVWDVSVSPSGAFVATVRFQGAAQVWQGKSPYALVATLKGADRIVDTAFSPDSLLLATAGSDKTIQLWSTTTWRSAGPLLRHSMPVDRVLFSPNGRLLLSCAEGTIDVDDLFSGKPMAPTQRLHRAQITHLEFSADGRLLATASRDGTVQLLDTISWQPTRILRHNGAVFHAAFSPDGQSVVTASADQTARVWDVATGQPLTPPLPHQGEVLDAAFHPDGRQVATAGRDRMVRFWELSPLEHPIADLTLLSQVFQRDTRHMDPEKPDSLGKAWQQLRSRHPEDFSSSPADVLAWYRRQASECEASGQWEAALWHLERLGEASLDDGNLCLRRSRALACLGKRDQAAALRARAVVLKADDPELWLASAWVGILQGHWKPAAADLDCCLALNPTDEYVGPWCDLIHAATGQPEVLRRRYTERLAKGMDLKKDLDAGNSLVSDCVLVPGAMADPARIVALAEKLVAAKPQHPGYLATLGRALYRAGRYQESARRLEQASRLDSNVGPTSLLFLAMDEHSLGHAAEARRQLRLATERLELELPHGKDAFTPPGSFGDLLGMLALRVEAEALILGQRPPSAPEGRNENSPGL